MITVLFVSLTVIIVLSDIIISKRIFKKEIEKYDHDNYQNDVNNVLKITKEKINPSYVIYKNDDNFIILEFDRQNEKYNAYYWDNESFVKMTEGQFSVDIVDQLKKENETEFENQEDMYIYLEKESKLLQWLTTRIDVISYNVMLNKEATNENK